MIPENKERGRRGGGEDKKVMLARKRQRNKEGEAFFLVVGGKYQWNRNREQKNIFFLPWLREQNDINLWLARIFGVVSAEMLKCLHPGLHKDSTAMACSDGRLYIHVYTYNKALMGNFLARSGLDKHTSVERDADSLATNSEKPKRHVQKNVCDVCCNYFSQVTCGPGLSQSRTSLQQNLLLPDLMPHQWAATLITPCSYSKVLSRAKERSSAFTTVRLRLKTCPIIIVKIW